MVMSTSYEVDGHTGLILSLNFFYLNYYSYNYCKTNQFASCKLINVIQIGELMNHLLRVFESCRVSQNVPVLEYLSIGNYRLSMVIIVSSLNYVNNGEGKSLNGQLHELIAAPLIVGEY